jgi:hypothetical protein
MSGYIKLYRDINAHWIWKSPHRLQWWIDILLTVNHADAKVMIRGQLVKCKRGQSVMSLDTWATRWGTTKKTVKRFFELLESDNMLEYENIQISTRISVLNYDNYQGEVIGHATKSTRSVDEEYTVASPEQLMNKNKEKNNIKEVNIPFETFWDLYGKKKGSKKDSEKRWNRYTDQTRQTIIDTLPKFLASINKEQYIPHPINYLRQERWNDEIAVPLNSKINPETGQLVTLHTIKEPLINPETGDQI